MYSSAMYRYLGSWNVPAKRTMNGWSIFAKIVFSDTMCSTCCSRITSAFFNILSAHTLEVDCVDGLGGAGNGRNGRDGR